MAIVSLTHLQKWIFIWHTVIHSSFFTEYKRNMNTITTNIQNKTGKILIEFKKRLHIFHKEYTFCQNLLFYVGILIPIV